jgi:hypothetical protein
MNGLTQSVTTMRPPGMTVIPWASTLCEAFRCIKPFTPNVRSTRPPT